MRALLARKIGMTQVNDDKGHQIPVTAIKVGPCVVIQRKTTSSDGYNAVQMGLIEQKEQRLTKAAAGHFRKHGVTPVKEIREVRLDAGEDVKPGETVTVKLFEGVTHVDVIGVTKGQGFQGVVKRHKMGGGPATHGHMSHRRIGAIGQRTWPARIMKLKRMPGRMGRTSITVQSLRVIQVRAEENVLLVEGSIPGPAGATVLVRKAVKKIKSS